MHTATEPQLRLTDVDPKRYAINSLDDEMRVDAACVGLLRQLFLNLTRQYAMEPGQAGELCHGADYFLREFIIADRKENLFTIDPLRVRQFAGHWYIVRALEPNTGELHGILAGTAAFYRFLAEQGLVTTDMTTEILANCADSVWHQQRMEEFWNIRGDGYAAWRQGCPLEQVADWP